MHHKSFMYKILTVLFFLTIPGKTWAQILPKEGSKLNYRIIGFSFPAGNTGCKYKIEIAAGNFNSEESFKKNIITSFSNDKNKIIGEVPSFGKEYTWHVVHMNKNGTQTKSALHHFSTGMIPEMDTNIIRFRVIKPAEKYKDAYIFLDGIGALYDMNGKPVWFLPLRGDGMNKNILRRDIKISPAGTITFLLNFQVYEIDYNGNILWKHTSKITNNKLDSFHHEFTRLSNGHYMGIILDDVFLKRAAFKNRKAINAKDSANFYQNIQFNNIVEFDKNDRIVWKWNGLKYIDNSDLFFIIPSNIFSL